MPGFFITAGGELPEDLVQYRIRIPFNKIHDAIHYNSLFFGESVARASEAADLGTPSIFMDYDDRGYTDEEESKLRHHFHFTESEEDQEKAIEKAVEIIRDKSNKEKYKHTRDMLLNECIDTTQFMINEVLKYQS